MSSILISGKAPRFMSVGMVTLNVKSAHLTKIAYYSGPFVSRSQHADFKVSTKKGHWSSSIQEPTESARNKIATSVKTRERRGSSFSQLGLEPNHTGLTAQSLFFLEESCRIKRPDTQTFSNFSNYFKRVLKLQKRSSSFSK